MGARREDMESERATMFAKHEEEYIKIIVPECVLRGILQFGFEFISSLIFFSFSSLSFARFQMSTHFCHHHDKIYQI